MNSFGLGVSPKWCQMDCAGPMEMLTNLFKGSEGNAQLPGPPGKLGGRGW